MSSLIILLLDALNYSIPIYCNRSRGLAGFKRNFEGIWKIKFSSKANYARGLFLYFCNFLSECAFYIGL